jgi:excisionase family DNA binding protein
MGKAAARPRNARLSLTRKEAADSLGISIDTFERHVQHELRLLRVGRKRLVPVAELQRFVESNAARLPTGLSPPDGLDSARLS